MASGVSSTSSRSNVATSLATAAGSSLTERRSATTADGSKHWRILVRECFKLSLAC
jgi:hypothetical protein